MFKGYIDQRSAIATIAAAAMLGVASVSAAQTDEPQEATLPITGNFALSSDYIFRGISQTDNTPAFSGGFDYAHDSGFYAGIWASNVDSGFFGGANLEIDTYVGVSGGEQLTWDVGLLRYNYPGTNFSDNNTNEGYGKLGYDFGPAAVNVGIAVSNDFFGLDSSEYYTADLAIPLPGDFSLAVGYGNQHIEKAKNYDHFSVGLSRSYGGLDFDLTFHSGVRQSIGVGNLDDARGVFTIGKSF